MLPEYDGYEFNFLFAIKDGESETECSFNKLSVKVTQCGLLAG